jgi:hypothetical protein
LPPAQVRHPRFRRGYCQPGPSIIRSYVIKLRLYSRTASYSIPSSLHSSRLFQLLPLRKEILYGLI